MPAPAPPAANDPTPTGEEAAPARVGPPDHGVTMPAVVIAVSDRLVRAGTPEGELELPVRKGAWKGDPPAVGDVVKLSVGLGPCGEFLVVGKVDHEGLPIQFGRVVEKTAEELTIQAPTGLLGYKLHPTSELAKGVDVGAWVSVKAFHLDEQPTLLSARAHPGKVQDIGVLSKVGDGTFTVRSLSGERCWRGDPGGLEEGEGVIVEGDWHNGRGFAPSMVRAQAFPATFIGMVRAREGDALKLVDAWGAYLGRVDFTLAGPCDAACQELAPGDMVEVDWHLEGQVPTVDAMRERPLAPVYAGTVDTVTTSLLRITTIQGRTKTLDLTPETVLAQLVAPGDRVEVVYRPGANGADPTAVVVAKR